jgi:glucose/arabinose dehydrogenase
MSLIYFLPVFLAISILLIITFDITPSFSVDSQPMIVNDESLVINKLAGNLDSPSSLEIIDNDILITQKDDGKVKLVRDSILKKYPVIDVNTYSNGIDNGLKSIASGSRNNITYVFLLFSESSGRDTDELDSIGVNYQLYRYIWNSSGLGLENKTLILTLPAINQVNTGGKMIVGPDNQLYITIGDLGREGKEQNIPPVNDFFKSFLDKNIKSSAILRVDFDGLPSRGNPFTEEGFEYYFAYGIRNSLGLAFDPITKYLWDTEQGPGSRDEINLVMSGFNSGWKAIQGFSNTTCCYDSIQTPQNIFKLYKVKSSYYDEPKVVFEYSRNLTSNTFQDLETLGPQYKNMMFVGDMLGNIYKFNLNKNRDDIVNVNASSGYIFAKGFGPISDLKVGPNGILYVLTYSDSLNFPFSQNNGSLYTIKAMNSPTKLSESSIITMELMALVIIFLIILAFLVSFRFKLLFTKTGRLRTRIKKS